jgi:oxygen-independent coproporphyrinogen-3 oxidase
MLATATESLNPSSLPAAQITGLYVHIPFCFHKCHYCDFYSITRQTPDRMSRFVDLILREADFWTDAPQTLRPRTVFFGGGTPTLLPAPEMRRLIDGLRERFDFANLIEWTVEANPATVTREYADTLAAAGIDRISMGAQSFNPAELAVLERNHNPDDVPQSLVIIKSSGIARLNLDLIYAIPGQNMKSWLESLERAIALGTEHLSCYGLTYEPNTPLAVRRRLGRVNSIDPDLEIEMLTQTRARLSAAGLFSYEISNYSRPECECQHNLLYWHGGDYLSLGPAAASHVQGTRWRNRPHLGEWETEPQKNGPPTVLTRKKEDAPTAQVKSQLEANQVELENLTKDANQLKEKIARYQERLNSTPVREQQLAGMLRDYELLKLNYADLLKKQLESGLAVSLEKHQEGQQFRVIDPASLPAVASPNRLMLRLGGAVGGLVLGLALAFVLDIMNRPFYTEKELSHSFPAPLVLGIPLLLTPAQVRKGSGTRMVEALAGCLLAMVVCVAEYYAYRHG